MREKSMPKLLEVMGGGNETKIYFQATICQTCVLAVPLTIKVLHLFTANFGLALCLTL
jgi:hypothetical protein